MSDRVSIRVADLVGGPLCISAEDGQKVFEKVLPLLKKSKPINISFDHVDMVISLFLNVAIGQLYGSFSEDEVRALVRVEGLSGDDMELLKHVVDNAKKYYSNPKGYDAAWQEEEEEDEQ